VASSFQVEFVVGGAQAYRVLSSREVHQLSRPAYLEVEALLAVYVDTEEIVGATAALTIGYDGDTRRSFAGIVESVTVIGSTAVGDAGRTYQYSFVIVSPLSFLAGNHRCLIQQVVDVKDAVTAVLNDAAPTLAVDWRLTGSYPKRAYCVQYQETDLAFISRLLESEGIYYFFEADDDGTLTLVFCDDSTTAKPIDGKATLHLQLAALLDTHNDSILSVSDNHAVVSGKFTLRDFNFLTPKVDMTSTAAASVHADFEVYDYPGGYLDPADGKRVAQLRLDAEQVEVETLSFETRCTRVSVGRKLTVAETGSTDGDWVVTRAVHEVEWDEAELHYTCRAELLPAKTKFRPARVTPRPVIEGPQTAAVVCPAGAQPEEILTDEHGQCKVKFHWDLGPAMDDKATAWMRVAQLQTSGSMMLPRVGWEVIVEFLEGDPDRPIVTGRLYNGAYMPPYALPDGKTRTSIKTASTPGGAGSNEIRMEDKSGSEEIMMHSQKDTNVTVANNKTKSVGNNETLNVGASSTTTVGANQTVKITKGSQNTITADQTVTVGGTRSLEVNAVAAWSITGSSTTTVGATQSEQIGNPLEALIALAVAKAEEVAKAQAAAAVAAVQGAVQGKIDQALGPVNDLVGKAGALGSGLQALGNGDLSALGGVVGGATGLPGVGAMGSAMAGSGAGAAASSAGGAVSGAVGAAQGALAKPDAAVAAAGDMLNSALGNAISKAGSAATAALDAAAGVDADGGGGSSDANAAGPVGDVPGVDQTDRAKGPGHSLYDVTGKHSETVGSIKVLAALNGINLNIGGNMTQDVKLATVQMAYGDLNEAVTGAKKEKELGLIVMSKGETEHAQGAKMSMVGGLVLDAVGGNQSVEATGNLTLIGAMQKLEASTSITLKCGESEVAITGDGISIKSLMVTMTAGTIELPKPAGEGA
jgi:type VI secretion system secreted protein VgrG